MARNWVTTTVNELTEWAGSQGKTADLEGVRLLLRLAREHFEIEGPGELEAGDLEDLLLEVFPEDVVAGPEDAPEIAQAARTLVEFLAETGTLSQATAAELRDELADIQPKLAAALEESAVDEDTAVEILAGMMRAEGIDVSDDDAVDAWVEKFEALPDDEKASRTTEYLADTMMRLPPVRLASADDLAAAAREAGRAGTGEWLSALRDALKLGTEYVGELTPAEIVEREIPGILLGLYTEGTPIAAKDLFDELLEQVEEIDDEDPETWAPRGHASFERAIADLAGLGLLRHEADEIGLTPLGVWGVRELATAEGYTAPIVGELAESPASELVMRLSGYPEDLVDEEVTGWLAGREMAEAAADLIAVMRAGSPGDRALAVIVLEKIGPAAESVVRSATDEPLLRPYAVVWLNNNGDTAIELTPEDAMWIFADTVAAMLEAGEPQEAIELAFADAPPDMDILQLLEDVWRIDHPDLEEVLDALGDHHPDKQVSKAARRAAFKARSKA